MKEVVSELRAFTKALKKRPDVNVTVATLGRKAGKKDVENVRKIHEELADLYAEMNGIHVEWEFIEPSGGGCLRIPPISMFTKFSSGDENFGFDTNEEAMLFDEITPEAATWLVKDESGDCRIAFGNGGETIDVPISSLAEYLQQAQSNGFGRSWPACFQEQNDFYREQEQAIERFQAPPITPAAIRIGVRVEFEYFSEKGRGEVLAIHDVPDIRENRHFAPKVVKLRTDEGTIGWFPIRFLKAQKKKDLYETMRDPAFEFSADLSTFEDLARAIGSHSRRAAGLLSGRTFEQAVEVVTDLCLGIERLDFTIAEKRELKKTGKEFSSQDFKGNWFHDVHLTFWTLFRGLTIFAAYTSSETSRPGNALIDSTLLEKLKSIQHESAAELLTVLTGTEIIHPPAYHAENEERAQSAGLPSGSKFYAGTGY